MTIIIIIIIIIIIFLYFKKVTQLTSKLISSVVFNTKLVNNKQTKHIQSLIENANDDCNYT
jgi:uncharacterized membrane protein YvbJ